MVAGVEGPGTTTAAAPAIARAGAATHLACEGIDVLVRERSDPEIRALGNATFLDKAHRAPDAHSGCHVYLTP